MPRGGKRPGAGRKPLVFTPQCGWIVDHIRKSLAKAEAKWRREQLASYHEAIPNILDKQSDLNQLTIEERQRRGDFMDETIEDIRAMLGEVAVRKGLKIDNSERNECGDPLPFGIPVIIQPRGVYGLMQPIFADVARTATRKFGHRITLRQVERCWDQWRELERIVSSTN